MAINSVLPPFFIFPGADGAPLEGGYIFIGQPGFEARTTPKASFFDVALTIPTGTASGSAIRTMGGFPSQNGSPRMFYVDGDFSISVTDRNSVLLYSALNTTLALNVGGTVGPVLAPDGSLGATGFGFVNEPNTGFLRSSPGVLDTAVLGALVSRSSATGTSFALPVSGAGFVSGVTTAIGPDLASIKGLGTGLTGILARTADGVVSLRNIVSAGGTVAITNPGGVAGDINLEVSAAGDYQAFTADGTWTKPAGVDADTMVWVEMWGGGASGRRDATNHPGGGGGGYARAAFRAGDLGATVAVTIGLGGAASGGNGIAGGSTTFGTHLGASGGASTTGATGGAGGSVNLVDKAIAKFVFSETGGSGGAAGVVGSSPITSGAGGGGGAAVGIAGGTSFNGGNGGSGGDGSPAPTAGTAPGGGGGGGAAVNSGAGANGEVRVWIG